MVPGGELESITSNSTYRKTVLDNGVRVVTENIPHLRSLAVGFWFKTGSRDEPENLAGIAHFLEHMNFKGTEKRGTVRIAREIEGHGGHLNAYTSKEVTCYYARVVDEQTARAVDVLSDITRNSLYNPAEIEKERDVILEELKTVEDTPDELVFEQFISQVFTPHSIGRSVLGTRESLKLINRSDLLSYSKANYNGSNVVIAAAGRINHDRFVRMIDRRFTNQTVEPAVRKPPQVSGNEVYRQDTYTSTQQAHILWGCRGLRYDDPRKFIFLVLMTILGGGMSSRLFQNIREKLGLAYSIYAFLETYVDTGLFGVYAATMPEKAEKVLALVRKEVKYFINHPVSDRELKRTKDQLKGNLKLSLESPNTRMHRLAKLEINIGYWLPIDDIIARIDAVSPADIIEIAQEFFEKQALYTSILWPRKEVQDAL